MRDPSSPSVGSDGAAGAAPPQVTLGEPMGRHQPQTSLKPGAVVGGYRVERPLGQGGMGRVYLAHDERLGRKVALKVLPPEDADDEARARFLREAQALARVHHDNVVQVFASGTDGDVAWMALEYVEGDALGALLGTGVDEPTALGLCAQAARGLAAVHAVGVVHRDVKPDNLLIDASGTLRVLDFGVAVFVEAGRGGFVTQKGVAVGTPHFMAPEQARGGAVDARADAWGLGATLYALLVGRPPFYVRDDESDLDILARVLRDRAPDPRTAKPGVSAATASLVARLLDPEPNNRPADLEGVADALLEIADALERGEAPAAPAKLPAVAPAAEATSAIPGARAPEPPPRWLATLGVLAVALLFLALGVTVGPMLAPGARAPDAGSAAVPPPGLALEPVRSPDGSERVLPVELVAPPRVTAKELAPEPTPSERAASIVKHPEANLGVVKALVEEDTDAARATLALVVADQGAAGDLALSVIAAKGARQHVPLVGGQLRSPTPGRALAAVGVLHDLKSEAALALLREAADTHANKAVRERARAAADEMFHVE